MHINTNLLMGRFFALVHRSVHQKDPEWCTKPVMSTFFWCTEVSFFCKNVFF